jgi:hypothetical protein
MGRSRIRVPVAWYTAFAIAGATPTAPSSPIPLTGGVAGLGGILLTLVLVNNVPLWAPLARLRVLR